MENPIQALVVGSAALMGGELVGSEGEYEVSDDGTRQAKVVGRESQLVTI